MFAYIFSILANITKVWFLDESTVGIWFSKAIHEQQINSKWLSSLSPWARTQINRDLTFNCKASLSRSRSPSSLFCALCRSSSQSFELTWAALTNTHLFDVQEWYLGPCATPSLSYTPLQRNRFSFLLVFFNLQLQTEETDREIDRHRDRQIGSSRCTEK